MTLLLLLANTLLLLSTALPLWNNPVWWVRGFDFPRLQILLLSWALLLLGLVWAYFRDWPINNAVFWFALCSPTLCGLFQASKIVPYLPIWPVQVKAASNTSEQPRVRVLAANVLTPNQRYDELLAIVRREQPDILLTLESDSVWESHLDSLGADYPHTVKVPLDNLYGMHLYSKMPLSQVEVAFLEQPDIPSIHCLLHISKELQVQLHCMHPPPPSPTESPESTSRDAELLALAKRLSKGCDYPVIVAGDLNDVAWSKTTRLFCRLSGLLDPRRGRGVFNTFHAKYWPIRWPLDHLFHSDHFRLAFIRRLEYFGSDHFPLLTELVYEPAGSNKPPSLNAAERALANKKIDDGDVSLADVPDPKTAAKAS